MKTYSRKEGLHPTGEPDQSVGAVRAAPLLDFPLPESVQLR
jgi:hypothetical protein